MSEFLLAINLECSSRMTWLRCDVSCRAQGAEVRTLMTLKLGFARTGVIIQKSDVL